MKTAFLTVIFFLVFINLSKAQKPGGLQFLQLPVMWKEFILQTLIQVTCQLAEDLQRQQMQD